METVSRIQTAFRLKPELLHRLKRSADERHMSLNAFVENELDKVTRVSFPSLGPDFKISDEIRALSYNIKVNPECICTDPQEQIERDKEAKYEYLKEKFGL